MPFVFPGTKPTLLKKGLGGTGSRSEDRCTVDIHPSGLTPGNRYDRTSNKAKFDACSQPAFGRGFDWLKEGTNHDDSLFYEAIGLQVEWIVSFPNSKTLRSFGHRLYFQLESKAVPIDFSALLGSRNVCIRHGTS